MKNSADNKTLDLLPGHDLAGERPAPLTDAAKARARMERYKEKHGKVALTVWIDAEVRASFEAVCSTKGKKKNDVVQRLIETQFLRKR